MTMLNEMVAAMEAFRVRFPPLPRKRFLVSRQALASLREHSGNVPESLSPMCGLAGVPVYLDESLPRQIRTGNIIQRDRFATYDADDMEWAEPLGVAEWATELCHCIEIDEPMSLFAQWPLSSFGIKHTGGVP